MACFNFFSTKSKRNPKPTTSAPTSNNGPSRSDDPGVLGQQTSKSSGTTTSKSSGSAASSSSQQSIPALYEERGHNNLRVFELDELRNATNDFSRAVKIGEGGFGSVYKGFVKPKDGKGQRIAVAVKRLNQKSLQGHKQWLAEVQFLGVVEHPNLVKLVGYCAEDGERGTQRLLVYEFMPNRSLDDHLFNRAYPPLPWNLRLQIALGAAEGLAYLHQGLEVQVIYRDFKASNVLLDKDFKPKLSDFGLAREGPAAGHTHVSTAVVGTYGYADPDYIATGHLTTSSDVWSFGVVLYELLTGRRCLERSRPANEQKLLEWVKQYPIDSRRFNMIMDSRLVYQFSVKAAREVARLADRCLARQAKERPKMTEVVEILKQAMHLKETGEGHSRSSK
ncbi:putative serine/threonine-protein kinase PBL19 [Iris pallida]|uniref:non-specific serine/threonine protein kinase n=1 Tax=Iris pallida TaxID=29817 RepID=A0AAX6EUM8_IRIPA|nr:putative serine/threonine-protein kinase PBL19 [Iris pallida]